MTSTKQRIWDLERGILGQAVSDIVTGTEEATSFLLSELQDGKLEMIQRLRDSGADPLKMLPAGKTILHEVARNGLVSVMKQLVGSRDVQSLPKDLIHEAVRRERPNIEMIKFLVQLGVDVNAKKVKDAECTYKDDSLTAMHLLAVADHWWKPNALDYLLTHGGDLELSTSQGRTVLQIAVRGRINVYDQPGFFRKEAIAVLLNHNARVNYISCGGRTPLIESFDEGVGIVQTLLSRGADVSFGNEPAISYAVTSFNVAVVETLVKAGADCNALCQPYQAGGPMEPLLLHVACGQFSGGRETESTETRRANAEEIIQILLKNGADPTKILEDGTPLITAVIRDFGVLKPFLSLGLDLESKDRSGLTPLLAASYRGYESAVGLLIEGGANVFAVDNERKNALHLTAKVSRGYDHESRLNIARKLIASGTPVDELDGTGFSPLHYAAKQQATGMIRTFLDAGVNAAAPYPSKEGKTILHLLLPYMACDGIRRHHEKKEYISLAQRFIDAGIDKEARDNEGNTAIFGYVAVRPSYDEEYEDMNVYPDLEEQCQILSSYNVHARNNEEQTLMHVVAKRNKEIEGLPRGRDDTRDMFKLLWDLGCDPKAEDKQQRTPLDVAAACGNTSILDLFAPIERYLDAQH